jgi:hypothetical protein
MKPLADAHRRVEMIKSRLRGAILPDQTHIKMAIICAAFAFLVTGGRLPLPGQIEQAVPIDAFGAVQQQFTCPLQTEHLDFIRPEGRNTHLRHPDRQMGDCPDLVKLLGPIIDLPMVPIQRETMHRHAIQVIQQMIALQQRDKIGINGRDPAEDQWQLRAQFPDGESGHLRHCRKFFPAGIHLEVPMRQVVRLVPQLDCFDHRFSCAPR